MPVFTDERQPSRTNIAIDDRLMKQAMRSGGAHTKKAGFEATSGGKEISRSLGLGGFEIAIMIRSDLGML
jgi:Bacterial antitoxin of type II TA system, VapB